MLLERVFSPDTGDGAGGEAPAPASEGMSPQEIADLFDLSFPKEEAAPAATPATAADGGGDAPEPARGGESGEGQEAQRAPEPIGAPASDPKLVSEVAELKGLVHGLATPRQVAPQGAPQRAPLPNFDPGQIPDEILEGMLADDPKVRRGAVQAFAAGLGARAISMAHEMSRNMMNDFVVNKLGGFVNQQVEVRDQMRQWHDNFYGEYEALGRSQQLKTMVGQTASQVVQEMVQAGQFYGYNDQLRDYVAKRVLHAMGVPNEQLDVGLNRIRRTKTPPAAPAVRAPAPVRSNGFAPQGARPVQRGGVDPNSPEGIWDIFN